MVTSISSSNWTYLLMLDVLGLNSQLAPGYWCNESQSFFFFLSLVWATGNDNDNDDDKVEKKEKQKMKKKNQNWRTDATIALAIDQVGND
ncbi:hypothetical protein BLOT_012642 [Blomia tropicalis]|nr:hypothetical protein BLOT_012642 [Blomia tropicalis]